MSVTTVLARLFRYHGCWPTYRRSCHANQQRTEGEEIEWNVLVTEQEKQTTYFTYKVMDCSAAVLFFTGLYILVSATPGYWPLLLQVTGLAVFRQV